MLSRLFRRAEPKVEQRAVVTGYTAQIMAGRQDYLRGYSGVAEATATVQACISLWEGALGMADIVGTDLLDARSLSLTARSLALRGEAVFLIGDRLIPAAEWDLATRDALPRAYRLTLPEANGTRIATVLAAEVLHFRIASDPSAPWSGQSPLRRSGISATFLDEIETALTSVYARSALGSKIVALPTPFFEQGGPTLAQRQVMFQRRKGDVLTIEGAMRTHGSAEYQVADKRVDDLSPDLSRSMTDKSLSAARDAIMGAFGVLPALMSSATTGPLVREAQRHLATWTLQPIAKLMAEEATAKLGGKVAIDTLRPVQAYDVGGRARALATIVEALARAKEAGLSPAEVNQAETLVNWGEGDGAA